MRRDLPHRVEVSSSAADPNRYGTGSSGYLGDVAADGIRIPTAATVPFVTDTGTVPAQLNRYLFRLTGLQVPARYVGRIRGLRTVVTIGLDLPVPNRDGDALFPVEIPVTTPFWCFPDGNVAFHLRVTPGSRPGGAIKTASPNIDKFPGAVVNYGGVEPGLVCQPDPTSGAYTPYRAPAGGQPPGRGIGNLDTWRDPTRFPWNAQGVAEGMEIDVEGPCTITLWGSVYQTNPATRVNLPVDFPCQLQDVTPEINFVSVFGDPQTKISEVVYYRIAGAIIADILPQRNQRGCRRKEK